MMNEIRLIGHQCVRHICLTFTFGYVQSYLRIEKSLVSELLSQVVASKKGTRTVKDNGRLSY